MTRARTDMEVTVLENFAAQALGYNSLKEHQIEVVLAVAGVRDVFAVLPTGYGKSLCYACLSSLFDNMLDLHTNDRSIVVVLTPLTAIIQDQVMKCYSEVDKSYIYFQVSSFSSRGLETGSGVLQTPRTPPGYRLEGWPIKITYCTKLAYTN